MGWARWGGKRRCRSLCARPGAAPPSLVPAGALSADPLPGIRLSGRLGTARPAAAQLASG